MKKVIIRAGAKGRKIVCLDSQVIGEADTYAQAMTVGWAAIRTAQEVRPGAVEQVVYTALELRADAEEWAQGWECIAWLQEPRAASTADLDMRDKHGGGHA
jgi:hypothetical protein